MFIELFGVEEEVMANANLTFRGPCIMIILILKANEMNSLSNLFDKVLYMSRTCQDDHVSRHQQN